MERRARARALDRAGRPLSNFTGDFANMPRLLGPPGLSALPHPDSRHWPWRPPARRRGDAVLHVGALGENR
eukprot:5971602-Pyramimonas_sp.AAC.1